MTEHEMTQESIEREIRSGWFRTLVTTLVGVMALAGSTYTVVSNITEMRIQIVANQRVLENHAAKITNLEQRQLPDGLERGQLQATLRSVQVSLDKIERRLERLEQLGSQQPRN